MILKLARSVLALLLALFAWSANAEHLGSVGPTYSIQEPDLLRWIEGRLREKEKNGELKRLQDEARARAVEAIKNPKPVLGLARVELARTFYFDPTFVLQENIQDAQGRLLFAAGTRKNPLEVVGMSKHLVFFDGRDKEQVAFVRRLMDRYAGRVKLVLVGGSYIDLMKAWKVPVFFDQDGSRVKQLGITRVPALVSQEGLRLRIDELVVSTSHIVGRQ